ncbi:hypothetical protein LCGC14_1582840 [marine sediment metagenome]|uniref:Uncharacterized protein n=1 Tax=marine sediment metagenome TaxID=412755 RepID=A0A0F9J2I8_9ZZZZ
MNLPHLGTKDIGIQDLNLNGDRAYWLVHLQCPKRPKSTGDRCCYISFCCYTKSETALCNACERQFGKKALAKIKDLTKFSVELYTLREMQENVKDSNTVFRAHVGFQPEQPLQD